MSSGFQLKCVSVILLRFAGACAQAQPHKDACEPYLRFQVVVAPETSKPILSVSPKSLQGRIGREPLSVVSLFPFDLNSRTNNTLSLLIIVWNGGLQTRVVERFVASLRKEERLHLRLSVLTRNGSQSPWTDDPLEQRRVLKEAAFHASSLAADEPGYESKTFAEQMRERQWNDRLRLSVENTIVQPGKQVILELLPPPPLRPPEGPEHWRIPSDRDYAGEQQVHVFAALGVVPVYRTHNATPPLSMIVPGGDASHSAPFGTGGNVSPSARGQEQLAQMQSLSLPPALPPNSRLFYDLGGKDVSEAPDALAYILADLAHTYSVISRTPASCTPRGLAPLRLRIAYSSQFPANIVAAPQWAVFYLLQQHEAASR